MIELHRGGTEAGAGVEGSCRATSAKLQTAQESSEASGDDTLNLPAREHELQISVIPTGYA
jgi:hypothetical protein